MTATLQRVEATSLKGLHLSNGCRDDRSTQHHTEATLHREAAGAGAELLDPEPVTKLALLGYVLTRVESIRMTIRSATSGNVEVA